MELRVGDNVVGCVELNGYAGEGISEKLYKYYNDALNNDSTAYKEKCKIIAEIWQHISKDYGRHKIQDIVRVMEWGKHHTFDVVLDGQWNRQKECFEKLILFHLKQCEQGLVKIHKQFHFHFQGLIKVIQQPWDNSVLRSILRNSEKTELTQKEIAYFANESGYATSMRIKKLVDAQCEDFAINLCSSYLKCLKLFEEGKVTLAVTEDQKKYAFDIYVALLYRVRRVNAMVGLLKTLSDKEAKELVGRFSSKNAVNCKVWKSSYKITFFSAIVFLHRHTKLETHEDQQTVLQIMKSWLKNINSSESIEEALKALKTLLFSQNTTSVFIYTVIEGLNTIDAKSFKIELYIRAMNKDLNRLEAWRESKEEGQLLKVSQKLSDALMKLAVEFDDHLCVARECILTAFSLNPTKQIFELFEKMAVRSGLTLLDTGQWECKFHAPVVPDHTTVECETCKQQMEPITLRAFNTNTILSEALTVENVGLPQQLCDDLVIVLCSSRYQLLSWLQEWKCLYRLCLMYLDNPQKTKNYITELKFVEIDYSLYQRGKRELEEPGLGYDNVLEESDDTNRFDIQSGATESCEEDLEIQFRRKKKPKRRIIIDSSDDEAVQETSASSQMKSDPRVTKTLRSFRKRKSDVIPLGKPIKVRSVEAEVDNTNVELLRGSEPNIQHNHDIYEEETALDLRINKNSSNSKAAKKYVEIDKLILNQDSNASDTVCDVAMGESSYAAEIAKMLPPVSGDADKADEARVKIISAHRIFPPILVDNIVQKKVIVKALASKVIIRRLDNNRVVITTVESPKRPTAPISHCNDRDRIVAPCTSITDCLSSLSPIESNLNISTITIADSDSYTSESELMVMDSNLATESDLMAVESNLIQTESNFIAVETNIMQTSVTKSNLIEKEQDWITIDLTTPDPTPVQSPKHILEIINSTEDRKIDGSEKSILEDVTQITKENVDVSLIEQVIGQKINRKRKPSIVGPKASPDSYLERLLNQPRFGRLRKTNKFQDFLYFSENRRRKQNKQVNTNKRAIVQEMVNEQDEEKRNETSPNILKSDNYHSGQKYSLLQDQDVKEQSNQEKSLFREKGTEGFYTEETGKIAKKPHRESNENKENSGYVSKRTGKGKIKRKPKKHRRLSKFEEKEAESDQEVECVRVSHDISTQLLQDVKVVLDRIELPDGKNRFSLSTDPKVFKMCEQLNRKLPRKPFADKNQQILAKWRSRNPVYNNIPMNPRVYVKPLNIMRNIGENKKDSANNKKNLNNNRQARGVNIKQTKVAHYKKYKNNTGNNAKSLLANVPGMKDTELMQPIPVANVVQVVQMTGRSSNSSSTTQTSTQVTPHIQRIGQPRQDKPETSDASATTSAKTTTNAKPTATQSSLLLSQQSTARTSTGNASSARVPPVVNILSNQVIRPATNIRASTTTRTTTTATTTMLSQSNNANRSTGESQLINQLTNPSRASTTSGGASTIKVATSSEPSRIVQFICQSSDGKLIPVSSFAQNCVVKVASSQNVSPTSPSYEENFSKAVKSKSSEASGDSEGSETLPKFQQAFGKSVYQSKPTGTNSTNITNNVINHEVEKPKITVVQKNVVTTTTTTTSVKPIPGGVIYTRQVQSGQTINLIPQSRGQVFRIATSNSDQISVVKDTLIQNKMNALLAAALSKKDSDDSESEKHDETTSSSTTATTRVAIARPGLVQNARIVKPVLQIPSNVIRNTPQNMSSTTLEQLREFDMVYKQVKERSSTTPASEALTNSETSESQCISVTYLNQGQKINCAPIVVVSSYNTIQPVSSPALNVVSQGNTSPRVTPSPSQASTIPKVTPKASKGKTVKTPAMQNTSKASPIPKPQQKPQEDEHTTQRIFDILAEYAEQLRNSPDLNNKPAPRRRSNPPTNPSQNSKRKKSSSSKKPSQSNSTLPAEPDTEDPRTLGSEDSSCGVMQLSVPDDEQPTTLASTSESNDSTSTPRQQLILTDSSNQPRNLIIAESSVGEALKMPNTAVLVPGNYIMPVSMVKGGQQIAVVSGGSKILATVPARSGPNMLLFQSFLNQNRKTSVPTVKYSTIQPISGISSQSLAGVTGQPPVILPPLSHSISTVTLGQPITVKKLDNSGQVNTELLLTISQSRENDSSEDTPQPDSSTNVVPSNIETVEIEEATTLSDNSSEKSYTPYQKPLITTPIATPVIAQTSTANTTTTPPKEEALSEQSQSTTQTVMTLNIAPIEQKDVYVGEQRKTEERIQTVLVTASSSNGSMITQTRSNFKDSSRVVNASQQNKDDFLRNSDKRNNEPKNLQSNNTYPQQGKIKKVQVATQRLDRELQQLCLQRKQAALERELRLQKSLSEECEDLGVDEPSTSDLFPEAELLFDSNHSPSFEQTSDVTKRIIVQQEGGKEEAKLTLFSDDDFLFEAGEYQKGENMAEYDGRTNGQSAEAGSPCEDATLLRTCTSMSDVTLNSPISPDTFHTTTPPPLHKYVHKYSNRKKSDKTTKHVDNWTAEVSSSEDTTGSNEIKSSSPEICLSKVTEEELADGNFKVVRVAIAKRECSDCSDEGGCSLSGRGARRSVKKLCSCCNGASSQDSRKRPAQPHQHVPVPQKKVFPVKKR